MFNTPILFLIFNRPDTTKQVFEKIREIKPKQLFIAADGPRQGNEKDALNCKAAREIVAGIDWDCEVKTLFKDQNLGCGKAVSCAISWFFEHVEEGIILEDDCLPSASFFGFCQEMLEKYKFNSSIYHICGSNYQYGKRRGKGDYYFSKLTHIWGWATWKRAWGRYEYCIELEDIFLTKAYPRDQDEFLRKEWKKIFDDFKKKSIDTWDYQWLLSCWKNNGITIIPNKNLIYNLGFGNEATHTTFFPNYYKNIKHENIKGEITHPVGIKVDYNADAYEQKIRMGLESPFKKYLGHIKKMLQGFREKR